jgi:hypothetical protein
LFARREWGESPGEFATKIGIAMRRPWRESGVIAASLLGKCSLCGYSEKIQPERGALMDQLGQLIERVNDLETQENKRRIHQIKIEVHQRLETKCFPRPERRSREVVNQSQYASDRANTRRRPRRQRKQKASAAAEVMALSRTSSLLEDSSSTTATCLFTRRRQF